MFKKIASNTFSQVLSKAGTALISIFLISILTNYLSVEMYGLYSKVYNYVGIFVFLADLGLYAITIREITAHREDSAKIVGNVMTLRLLLGILILIMSTFLAYFLPGYNSTLALGAIFISGFFTLFQLLNSSILALMQANMKIEFGSFSIVLSKFLNLVGVALIAYVFYKKGPYVQGFSGAFLWIMGVGVLSVVFNTILNFWYARKIVRFGFVWDFDYIKHIFKISLPYGIALFLSIVYFKEDILLLSLMEGPGQGDISIALYSLPMKIVEVVMVVGGFYMTSLLPTLTRYFQEVFEKKKAGLLQEGEIIQKKIDTLILISFKVLFAASFFIFIVGVLFRRSLIQIIAKSDYLLPQPIFSSSDAFLVVFSVVIFYFISLIFIYTLIASHHQSKLLRINIWVTLFNLLGNIILIPYYSFIGSGIVTLLSQMILTVLGYFFTRHLISFKLPFVFLMKNILFGGGVYVLGNYILSHFSRGIYFDFGVYGGICVGVYLCFFAYIFKELKRHHALLS